MPVQFRIPIKYGLIAGLVVVGYFLAFYVIQPELMFNPFVYWASLGIILAVIWKALLDEKAIIGREYTLNQALRTAFGIFVIGNLIYYLYYYLLHGLIDPGLVDVQKQVIAEALEAKRSMLQTEQIEALEKSLEDDSLKVTPGSVFFTYIRALIGNFVLALGLAYFASR
jgi:prepilin signal peptidase PulO-like enzyme (type II secretory pathway)